jgi:predicted DNA-binding antitoxin AbrB/MazE fold protein
VQKIIFGDEKKMKTKAIYEEGILKPIGKLDLKEGEEVEIEVKKSPVERLEGMIRISNRRWVKELIESPDLEPI